MKSTINDSNRVHILGCRGLSDQRLSWLASGIKINGDGTSALYRIHELGCTAVYQLRFNDILGGEV